MYCLWTDTFFTYVDKGEETLSVRTASFAGGKDVKPSHIVSRGLLSWGKTKKDLENRGLLKDLLMRIKSKCKVSLEPLTT